MSQEKHRLTYEGFTIRCSCGWRYERPALFGYHFFANRAVRQHFNDVRDES